MPGVWWKVSQVPARLQHHFVLLFSMAWWVVTDKWGGVRIVVEKTVKESEFCSFPQMLLLQFCIPTF
jgi:hypothetical protein